MNLSLRIGCIVAFAFSSQLAVTLGAANGPSRVAQGHLSGLMAKVTLPNGAIRTVRLEGVGCTASMCSRTTIKGKTEHDSLESMWLDAVAAIKETTEAGAVLVMRDGTQRRVSLVKDFRVLYLSNGAAATERLDLAQVKSVEFLPLPPTVEGRK